MVNEEKTGCTLGNLHYANGSQTCEAEKCMVCSEGSWEQITEGRETSKMQNSPSDLEPDKGFAKACHDTCELNGVAVAGGSVVCQSGECEICFKNKWLH